MPVRISLAGGDVAHITVLIERLWVSQISVWNRNRNRTPVRRDESP